jgi:hypothetical protein
MRLSKLLLLSLMAACTFAHADKKRDPLTDSEVAQIRDATEEPQKRVLLYVQFAKTRMLAIEQVRADNKIKDRAKQIHDLLEDFTALTDELDSNIDMFVRQREDLRKALKVVVESYTDWQLKLRGIKEAANVPTAETRAYDFPLESAIESVNSGLDSSRELLDKQNKEYKELKKKK